MSGMERFANVAVLLVLSAALVLFLAYLARSLGDRVKSERSQDISLLSQVAAKRTEKRGDQGRQWYYMTFLLEAGNRLELEVDQESFELLAEGDRGRLAFQGTRYRGFEKV